ncbi:MAG TPA: cysteine desulfurase family protein [Acidimicrobiales bacterium]|nr:cysteine desulfurase family protein [Acidimicrobiales bacterium]
MPRHYLDHASTSPARPEAVAAMVEWLSGGSAADPGRVHTEGRMARAALEDARERVAALVNARPREVVFTSGATEAINAAVFGATAARGERVVAGAVEHSAVLEPARRHELVRVGVDGTGRVDLDQLDAAVTPATALVCVQWGNHEVATLQPIEAAAALCHDRGVLLLVDAAQAVGHAVVDFGASGADLMAVSSHKLGGPKGAGALLVRRGLRLPAFILGGDQERARRGGIENVPALVGFGAAASAVGAVLADEIERAAAQTERVRAAASTLRGVAPLGDPDPAGRLPHIACLVVAGVEAEAVLLGLDQAGIAAHSGSACSSESLEPSPVLEAMGVEAERSLRVSVGWSTTDADIEAFSEALPRVVDRLRGLAAQSPQ